MIGIRRHLTAALLAAALLQTPLPLQFVGEAAPPSSPLSLWYRRPADTEWVRALPVGNGRLGAMVFGGVVNERLQLNEDTLWAVAPYDPVNPDAREALPEVRRLLAAVRLQLRSGSTRLRMKGRTKRIRRNDSLFDLALSPAQHQRFEPARRFQQAGAGCGMQRSKRMAGSIARDDTAFFH